MIGFSKAASTSEVIDFTKLSSVVNAFSQKEVFEFTAVTKTVKFINAIYNARLFGEYLTYQ